MGAGTTGVESDGGVAPEVPIRVEGSETMDKGKMDKKTLEQYRKKLLEKRNELILEYLPLVKFIANRISGRLPNHVELDDLIESGIIGPLVNSLLEVSKEVTAIYPNEQPMADCLAAYLNSRTFSSKATPPTHSSPITGATPGNENME